MERDGWRRFSLIAVIVCLCLALLSACSANAESGEGASSLSDGREAAGDAVRLVCISDIHLTGEADDHLQHLETALADVNGGIGGCDTLCIAGDGVDGATQAQYDQLKSELATCGYSTSEGNLFVAMGNHECAGGGDYEALWNRFEENWGYADTYHDQVAGDVHIIALGSDQVPVEWTHASYSQRELDWLDGLLEQDREAGRISVVICHHPVIGTVDGSLSGQYATVNRIDDSDALRAVLQKYDNAIYLSGHTHLDLTNAGCVSLDDDGTGPLYIHDGAVAYLRESKGAAGLSQGLVIEVSENQVSVQARDFTDGATIWSQTYLR